MEQEYTQNLLVDNSKPSLQMVGLLKKLIANPSCNRIRIATGYWDLPGTNLVYDELKVFLERGGRLDILIGQEPMLFPYQRCDLPEGEKFPDFFIRQDLEKLKDEYQAECTGRGERAPAYLSELHRKKFSYLYELFEQQPEAIRNDLNIEVCRILNSVYDSHPFAAHRVLQIRHSERLGTFAVLETGPDCSDVVLEHMLKAHGCKVRARVPGWGGVGVQVLEGNRQYQVPISEVKSHGFWQLSVDLDWTLPLPMGLNDFGEPHVVDLDALSCLVNISADRAGMTDFAGTIVTDLAKSRKPDDVRFLTVDGSNWVLNAFWLPFVVPCDYLLGEQGPGCDLEFANSREILGWCLHATRQLGLFKCELEERKRLFAGCKAKDFEDYKWKSKCSLPHWVLCIASLPAEAVEYGDPAYAAYQQVLDEVHEFIITGDLREYGMHVVYFTYSNIDALMLQLLHGQMDSTASIGIAVTYGNFTVADSYAMIGSPDATRVGGGRCIYRSPLGEITDYCASVSEVD